MQLRQKSNEIPELNLTSLIDVVFLLLIFFMISTTFEQAAGLKVSLPEAETAESQQQLTAIVLAIDEQGSMALDNSRLNESDADALRMALENVDQGRLERGLIIHADAEVAHRFVVTAMDVASKLGITNLSIATLEEGAENPNINNENTTVPNNDSDIDSSIDSGNSSE